MRNLYWRVMLVVLVTNSSCWYLIKAKHIPDDEELRQTYGNIPIGDPSIEYVLDIGAPLNEADLAAYNNMLPEGRAATIQNDLKVDPITLAGLYQGDIIINSRQELKNMPGRSAVSSKTKLWPNGIIPYLIARSFDSTERSIIAKAMDGFKKKTCLKFVPRNRHKDYVHLYKGLGCSSTVGRKFGRQSLSLGRNCVNYGTVLHELMHATGFWHEQSRYDRDEYVTIKWNNIIHHERHNFDKRNYRDTTGLPYDYKSLMHYRANAWAIDNRFPTIVSIQGVSFGDRKDFSELDLKGLNKLYKCTTTTPITTSKLTHGQDCKDVYPDRCKKHLSDGHCDSNRWANWAYHMKTYCKKSCNICDKQTTITSKLTHGQACKDTYPDRCKKHLSNGHCESKRWAYIVRTYCKKSCNLCDK